MSLEHLDEFIGIPALSIRQPWASLIASGYKDIENRTWKTKYRGLVLIHAALKIDAIQAVCASEIATHCGVTLSVFLRMLDKETRGGIVGVAEIVDCVTTSNSPWFSGAFGFKFAHARPLPFTPCKGALSFFKWEGGIK